MVLQPQFDFLHPELSTAPQRVVINFNTLRTYRACSQTDIGRCTSLTWVTRLTTTRRRRTSVSAHVRRSHKTDTDLVPTILSAFFASPIVHHAPSSTTYETTPHVDLEQQQKLHNASVSSDPSASNPEFEAMDSSLHDSPSFHRHAEATTAELFYDLFFVANLTTFTSVLEINDRQSLTAYIGFFSLLWLTWYQVSLYDVRFSADSVFERVAKAIHFGVMVRSSPPIPLLMLTPPGWLCSHWSSVEARSGRA